jgi:thioredoxin-related protein
MLTHRLVRLCVAFLFAGSMVAFGSAQAAESKKPETKKEQTKKDEGKKEETKDDLWTTDFAAAQAKAKSEKKYLLMAFTGSDWCGPCKALKAKVFDSEQFKAAISTRFVLVDLDFPHKIKLAEELKKQNAKLAARFEIKGFPTVVLLDAEDHLIAQKVGGSVDAPGYIKTIEGFVDAYEAIVKLKQELAKAQGLNRAKVLDQLVDAQTKLNGSSDELLPWSKEVVTLDPDNKSGLGTKHAILLAMAECKTLREAKKNSEAKAVVEKILSLPGVTGQQKQDAYATQSDICDSQHDFTDAVALLNKAIEAAADSSKVADLKKKLEHLDKMVAAQKAIAGLKAELDKAKGLDRVKLLDQLIEAEDKIDRKQSEVWAKELVSLDPENKSGLTIKHQFRLLTSEGIRLFQSRKITEGQAVFQKALALHGLSGTQIFETNVMLAQSYQITNNLPKCVESLKKAVEADPKNPMTPRLKAAIQQLEKNTKKEVKSE